MSASLPLRDRSEAAVANGLALLPARLLRPLLGPPIIIDGQRLNSQMHLAVRLLELSGAASVETMSPAEARVQIRADAAKFQGRPIPVDTVRDLVVKDTLPARLYVPAEAGRPGPLLLFFHGGGFVFGDLDTHDNTCRFLARHAGVRVLAVDYRLAPEHCFPAAYEDALAAFKWTIEHAADLGADSARVAVGGDSAGGNLATGIAQAARGDGGPAFQLLFYPWLDLSAKRRSYQLFGEGFFTTEASLDWERAHYLGPDGDPSDPRCSPALTEDLAGLAPAYVASAGFDPLRDEAEEYAMRLRRAGVRVALRRHADLNHAFANTLGFGRMGREALLEACGALRIGLA